MTRRLVQTNNRLCRAQHWDTARASAPTGMAAPERLTGRRRCRGAPVEAESQLPEVLMTYVHTIRKMAQWFALADADVASVSTEATPCCKFSRRSPSKVSPTSTRPRRCNGLWAEMALAAYNLVRMAKLMPPPSSSPGAVPAG